MCVSDIDESVSVHCITSLCIYLLCDVFILCILVYEYVTCPFLIINYNKKMYITYLFIAFFHANIHEKCKDLQIRTLDTNYKLSR